MSVTAIRTPDQRLRVFVSSTLHELAAERSAAREAIENIHLSPVMFELGARAHPPRDLYRAYLAQSDVFVGIYAARYGWIAPGMEISGLEDEFALSSGMPRLIYVKRTPEREPRLQQMLERIEGGELSYRLFAEPSELIEVIAGDLALMLTERFAAAATEHPQPAIKDEGAPPLCEPPPEQIELIGREGLVDEVGLRMAESAIVTLTGPGGTGKTSLAVHLAHRLRERFPDGVYYVPLAAVRDASEVTQVIASTLELPVPQGGADPLKLVTGFLRQKTALLVLDNFEQVLDAARDVAALVSACRGLRTLITSRTALRLRGEREVPVPTLEVAGDAVRLFEARAQAVRPSFAVTDENRAAVVAICRRLDGLPLAIELAASRVRALTPQAILPRLDRSLSLLTGGAPDLPERHQTLRGALAWSFDLLSEGERTTFRRLGAFTGGFGLGAAEAVIGAVPGFDAVDGLMSLVDKSLLVRTDVFDEPRYHMLETVREFALEHLAVAGEVRDTRLALARWALDVLTAGLPGFHHDRRVQTYERLLVDESHFRAALQWCFGLGGDTALGWQIFFAYGVVLVMRARLREAIQWYDLALAAGPCVDDIARLKAQVVRGGAASATNDAEMTRQCLLGTAEVLRAHGEWLAAGWASACWGQTLWAQGDAAGAEHLDLAIGDFQAAGDVSGEVYARSMVVFIALLGGDSGRARELALAALDLAHEHGDSEGLTQLTVMLGRIALAEGDQDRARELFANAAAIAREKGATWGRVDALTLLSGVALAQHDTGAPALIEEAVEAVRCAGLGYGLELLLGGLAGLAVRAGDLPRAARLFQLIPEGFEDLEDLWVVGMDPTGSLRAEMRAARLALGPRARCAPDRDAVYEEVLDLASGRLPVSS